MDKVFIEEKEYVEKVKNSGQVESLENK